MDQEQQYKVLRGPEAFLPPAAATMGIVLPNEGDGLIEGSIVPEDEVMVKVAEEFLKGKVPTIFPGPLVLWNWNEKSRKKATAIQGLYQAIKDNAKSDQTPMIIPMPDYRPKYPKINPEIEINPNHPNLTIWHNKIDVCMFVGVHCHQANLSLKIIRGGTDCYTMAMCAQHGHEDAMVTFRDATAEKIDTLAKTVRKLGGK